MLFQQGGCFPATTIRYLSTFTRLQIHAMPVFVSKYFQGQCDVQIIPRAFTIATMDRRLLVARMLLFKNVGIPEPYKSTTFM